MREIGMPFRDDMAEAIRKGLKTQTRRLIEPQPPQWAEGREIRHIKGNLWGLFAVHGNAAACQSEDVIRCPWQVGDRIFVQTDFWDLAPSCTNPDNYQIWDDITRIVRWKPDGDEPIEIRDAKPELEGWIRRPAKEMPSWAARTWLEITEIRAQRIREICEADCIAEGMPAVSLYSLDCDSIAPSRYMKKLWESLYPGSWERNEFVFVLTFKRIAP